MGALTGQVVTSLAEHERRLLERMIELLDLYRDSPPSAALGLIAESRI